MSKERAEFEKKVKALMYNTKRYTKADLIRGLEQILRETKESIINTYEKQAAEVVVQEAEL